MQTKLINFYAVRIDNGKSVYGLLFYDEDYDLSIQQEETEESDFGGTDIVFVNYKVVPSSIKPMILGIQIEEYIIGFKHWLFEYERAQAYIGLSDEQLLQVYNSTLKK